jgi:hypothetical protein
MLLAEDLLLLLTDDESGKLLASQGAAAIALGGANLVELTLTGKVALSADGRVAVGDPSPPADEVLATALATLTDHQGDKPQAVIGKIGKDLRPILYQRLADSGTLREKHARILGIFPTTTWPAIDGQHEAEIRRLIDQALGQGAVPDPRTAALIALLHAMDCEDKVVDPQQYGISKKELRARAEQIAAGDWASEAVRKAIQQMMAAIMAATTAATTAATAAAASG